MGNLFSKSKHKRNSSKHQGGFDSLEDQHNTSKYLNSHMDKYTGTSPEECNDAIHTEAVTCLAAYQPGHCLSGSKDQSVCLYDYCNKTLEERWLGHDKEVTKVCYGPFCQGIFSASRDKSVNMWKRGSSSPLRQFIGHDLVVTALAINQDNTLLCTGSRDNFVKLWDVETGTSIAENNIHRNLVTDVKFVPNSNLIVQTGEDKEVRLYDVRSLSVVHSFQRKQYIQMFCDVSPDGSYCLTCSNGFGGNGCEATFWDLRSRNIIHEFKGHTEAVDCCVFLPFQGQKLIATSSRDCSVKIWNQDTRECISECVISGSGPLTSLLCYDESSICVSSFNLGIHILQFTASNRLLTRIGGF